MLNILNVMRLKCSYNVVSSMVYCLWAKMVAKMAAIIIIWVHTFWLNQHSSAAFVQWFVIQMLNKLLLMLTNEVFLYYIWPNMITIKQDGDQEDHNIHTWMFSGCSSIPLLQILNDLYLKWSFYVVNIAISCSCDFWHRKLILGRMCPTKLYYD